ncbi:MAG: hypothetical protein ACLSCV_08500 [Acutalibacteraceae bacterium]
MVAVVVVASIEVLLQRFVVLRVRYLCVGRGSVLFSGMDSLVEDSEGSMTC